jgi:hypothetical protein
VDPVRVEAAGEFRIIVDQDWNAVRAADLCYRPPGHDPILDRRRVFLPELDEGHAALEGCGHRGHEPGHRPLG